ncbi:MAG TPA: sodium:proton antiporter [Bacteroidales bacterium]|nr:sodium:proton antiporter [Bacteroidales bacterium]
MNEFIQNLVHEFQLPLNNPVLVFSLILLIILIAPILLRKLNIPGIIGLIISGVIIGPFGLNFLAKDSAVELFSTIGILYIMFIAGLELDMNEFKSNRNKSLLFGFFTFIIPFSVGFPIAHYLMDYELNASLLIASMFSTHTLVAYPIVSKLGVSKNQAVAVTVGGTILTDSAVLIVLAIIMSNDRGGLDHTFWLKLGVSLIIFSAIMFLLIPKITKWFFTKLESEKHAHYIFVLSVVFFSAFLAEISGLEPIIGAFVAGLALNPLIPSSSALMNRIEFIGNSLFIPFFLISVGMLIDIGVVLSGPKALIIAAILTIVALFGKWLAALFTQLIFKYSSAQRQLIFGLSSSHAAAILAVVLVGYNAGILDDYVLNGTVVLILITCVVASFATERASKRILLTQSDSQLSNTELNLLNNEHILLPITNLSNMEKLLEFALLIKDKKSANPVTVLSVVPNNAEAEINIISTKKKLEEFKVQGAAAEIKVNTIATIDHNPSSGIARISREIMADIIVLGWPRKSGVLDKFIGEKIYTIINKIDKNLFICQLEKLQLKQKRIFVISTPLAEQEKGFEIWLQKIFKLSQELSIPIVHFGCESTQEAIKLKMKKKHLSSPISFQIFTEWEDFLVLSKHIYEDDLIVLISARKNAASHVNYLDNLPNKVEKYFSNNNKIIVYPQQYSYVYEQDEDISTVPLQKSIEAFESLGKGISRIFHKK